MQFSEVEWRFFGVSLNFFVNFAVFLKWKAGEMGCVLGSVSVRMWVGVVAKGDGTVGEGGRAKWRRGWRRLAEGGVHNMHKNWVGVGGGLERMAVVLEKEGHLFAKRRSSFSKAKVFVLKNERLRFLLLLRRFCKILEISVLLFFRHFWGGEGVSLGRKMRKRCRCGGGYAGNMQFGAQGFLTGMRVGFRRKNGAGQGEM